MYKNKKKIMHKSAARKIIKECNEQIDLDFIKESNLLENIEDVDVHTFWKMKKPRSFMIIK